MSYALGLPAALRARGLTVETVPGWETRSAGSFNPHGAVSHWTAGPATRDRPSLSVCINGHGSLAGPLCNVFLTRGGVAIVVAAGRANHAGIGGWRGLVGNSSVFGTEAENSGFDPWTSAQLWSYPRINAAYCDLGGFGPEMVCAHFEWTPRKIDIRTWPGGMPAMRGSVMALLKGEVDDVSQADVIAALQSQAGKDAVRAAAAGILWTPIHYSGGDVPLIQEIAQLRYKIAVEGTSAAELKVAIDGMAGLMAPQIAEAVREELGDITGTDPATIEAAAERAIRKVLVAGTGGTP